MNGPTNRRLIRRVLIALVFASSTSWRRADGARRSVFTPRPRMHASRTPPRRPAEVLDDTTTTAGEVLDDTTTTAGQVLDDTTTTAGQVLDDTTTTAGGVVGGAPGPVVGGLPGVPPGTGGQPSQGGSDPPPDQPVPPGGGSTGGGDHTQVGPTGTGTQGGPLVPAVGPGLVARHRSSPASIRGSAVGRTSASWTVARARCRPVRGSRGRLPSPSC